ncbi:class IV lanthionine synthetase LanL [Streptomyces cellostaticus]|uniref:class IV lanthionine synthetase LanL n=1 Tax=Streptomyces cellostaticus TaxID=67285 RepID=UPI000A8ABC72|nr:class IV lanthionine synthetase LanL [Streptomyces cellostaticus]GHI10094.1 serine/threonine protein kinase [Streptomyces cellostaticus]
MTIYQRIVAQVLADTHTPGQWDMRDSDFWCMVIPPDHRRRSQGWKLHVSATPVSASEVLERASRVLVRHGCAFKFAVSPRAAFELNAVRANRAQSGKFLTVYPADDTQLRLLAEDLHTATAGLPGPAILSDRRYRPDSLVHYRYGCFSRPRELNDEGFYEGRLEAPDGSLVSDQRNPWFSPPSWATLPFGPSADAATPARKRGGPVTVADRYLVREAIRHSNRGGVYRAQDTRTGESVLLKEARPHVGADPSGRDARDWLRHEAVVLRRLASCRVAPATRDVLESAGHVFLVEDLIDGTSLQQWAADLSVREAGRFPVAAGLRLARDLTRVLGKVHAAGFVLRDFKPSNVVMTPDGTPVLVDMECAVPTGETAPVAGTRGFTDPGYLDGVQPQPAEPQLDCYGLGSTLLHVTTGINPLLAPDDTAPSSGAAPRTAFGRLAAIVDAAAPASPALRALAPLVRGLTAEPAHRWSLADAARFLRGDQAADPVVGRVAGSIVEPDVEPTGPQLADDQIDMLLCDGLAWLAETMDPAAEYLWPRPTSLPYGDPCNVQWGAAGVLAVLDRAVRAGHQVAEAPLRTAAQWLDQRLTLPSRVLPGLYFGRSGAAWALHEAARTLDDPALAERAAAYALRIPLDWHNPDICHGLAGAGLAQLHLWHATGDPRFADRAHLCADGLLKLTRQAESGVDWLAGPEHRADLAGSAAYGFGHGVAGNAAFLLAVGRDTDRPDLVEVAVGGGHALLAVAQHDPDGTMHWPKGPGRTDRPRLNFWCNGTSGVGTFLVRLWQHTGDLRFGAAAEGAAHAVHRDRWRLGPSTCHGGAGNAELLLDLADATGDDSHRHRAAQAATCLFVRAARLGGRLLVPDDTLRDVCAGYNVGLAGVLDFLLRLRHGGRRSWLTDPH